MSYGRRGCGAAPSDVGVRSPGSSSHLGTMKIFDEIRGLREAIQTLALVARSAADVQRDVAPSEARLEELERSRATWEANMEALVLKADSTLRSASNAESRARTMEKHVEKHLDPFGDDSDEGGEAVGGQGVLPRFDVESLDPEEVLALPIGLEGAKSNALRRKFG